MTYRGPCPNPDCAGSLFLDDDGEERCYLCGRSPGRLTDIIQENVYADVEREFGREYAYAAAHQHPGFRRRGTPRHRGKSL
jgi:hypothetical protein